MSDITNSNNTKLNDTNAKQYESMLTTVDNPFDPFTQFKPWFSFDIASGYHTLALLARIINTSNEMSEADQLAANELAIDEILMENVSGMHRRVMREVQQEVQQEVDSNV